MDADQIVCAPLNHIWEGDFDIGVVQNSNPREFQSYSYQFMNINPLQYVNNGLVVMKNPEFVDHWLSLCNSPIFTACQMREQDLLNILCLQNYNIKYLDASHQWHGLISKGFGPSMKVVDNKIVLPKNEEWNKDEDKEIVVIHFGGGNDPNKGKIRLLYPEEVVKKLEEMIK